jgi:hypothetical protein
LTGNQASFGESKKTTEGESGPEAKNQARNPGSGASKKTRRAGRPEISQVPEKPSKTGAKNQGRKRPGNENDARAEKTIAADGKFGGSRAAKKHRTDGLKNARSGASRVFSG